MFYFRDMNILSVLNMFYYFRIIPGEKHPFYAEDFKKIYNTYIKSE